MRRGVEILQTANTNKPFEWGVYTLAILIWECLRGPAPHPIETGEKQRLSPDFVGWMMGFEEGWNNGENRTNRLKQYGNAAVPQQAALALRVLWEEGKE